MQQQITTVSLWLNATNDIPIRASATAILLIL